MSLSAGLSLRGQLAIHAAAVSLLAVSFGLAVIVPTVDRVATEQLREDTRAIASTHASRIVRACAASRDRPACEAAELPMIVDRFIVADARIAIGDEPRLRGAHSAVAQLERGPPSRWLLVERLAGESEKRVASRLRLAVALAVLDGLVLFFVVYVMLVRMVARPAERLLLATDRIGRAGDQPLLADEGPVLGRLGMAFDRMGERLAGEKRQVDAHVAELVELNRTLEATRELMVRQEKLATVGRLSAGVAHEIGNPVAALLGYLEILRTESGQKALPTYVERMERETRRIDRIVRDLLDFARPQPPSAAAHARLEVVIEQTLSLVRPQRRFRELTIETVPPSSPIPLVVGDPNHLQQVLLNLLVNAADAQGGVGMITVRSSLEETALGPRGVLHVRDRGPGIDESQKEKLFEPFFTTKAPGEGTGLGLAICHAIVAAAGGAIVARNAEDGGAEFRVELLLA